MSIEGVELALALIETPDRGPARPDSALAGANRRVPGSAFLWKFAERRLSSRVAALRNTPLSDLLADTPSIECRSDLLDNHSDDQKDIDTIRAFDLDFIVRFDSSPLPERMCALARHGVWRFQWGAGEGARWPPGFWEIYRGEPVTCAALVGFKDGAESPVCLKYGRFKTRSGSYVAQLDHLLTESSRWLAQACLDLAGGSAGSATAPYVPVDRREEAPGNLQCIKLYLRTKVNKAGNFCRNFLQHRHWGLAIAFCPIQSLWLDPASARIALLPKPPRSTFYADPFGMAVDGGLAILHETCNNTQGQGRIACAYVDRESMAELERTAGPSAGAPVSAALRSIPVNLEFPHHCSYPYVFSHEGTHYCIPETGDAGRVSLYRCTNPPGGWEHVTDIITGFPALDSTVVQYGGRWWLFCTSLHDNPDSHLYLWHADNLDGPWSPHLNNPVKMDICSARPAGTPFEYEGSLYRPAQDSRRNYGGAVSVQRITELTPATFSEEDSGNLSPLTRLMGAEGMHTISRVGDLTLLDYYRHAFLPTLFIYRLKLYIRMKRKRNP